MSGREERVIETFLALTDTLVHDFDALDMLTMLAERSTELLDVPAAGIILADTRGRLSVAAASSERSRLLEVFAVDIDAGPCVDCVRTGRAVSCEDLTVTGARQRWPRYALGAEAAGFRATHAVPLKLRDEVIGVLTLLHTDVHPLAAEDARVARALADAATIGLLHERALRRSETAQAQLQGALDSRVIIEQAKGVLAAHSEAGQYALLSPADAFTLLRAHARSNGLKLSELARGVVERTVDPATVIGVER